MNTAKFTKITIVTASCAIFVALVTHSPAARSPASGDLTIRQQSRAVVAACEAQVKVSDWQEQITYVIDESDRICEKRRFLPDWKSGSDVAYDLQRLAGGFRIDMGIRVGFDVKHPYNDPYEMLENMNSCSPLIAAVWKRYGIEFAPWFTTASDVPYHLHLNVHDQDHTDGTPRRSNSSTIAYGGIRNGPTEGCHTSCESGCSGTWFEEFKCRRACRGLCEPVRQNELCLTLLHETGHMLGLPDEYADKECPDRRTVRTYSASSPTPRSVMENENAGWSQIEFFPEHLELVLKPLCR